MSAATAAVAGATVSGNRRQSDATAPTSPADSSACTSSGTSAASRADLLPSTSALMAAAAADTGRIAPESFDGHTAGPTLRQSRQSTLCGSASDGSTSAPLPTAEANAVSIEKPQRGKHIEAGTDMAVKNCRICGRVYRSRRARVAHEIYCAQRQFPQPCTLCGKLFSCKKSRLRHEREQHSGDLVQCPHCYALYPHANHLRRHLALSVKCREIRRENGETI